MYKPMHPRKRICKIIRDLKELIIDKQSWNDNRPEEMPFDVGHELVELKRMEAMLAAWDRGDITAVKSMQAESEKSMRDAINGDDS